MLCRSDGNIEYHQGFSFWKVNALSGSPTSECNYEVAECFQRCENKYGGSHKEGNALYCAKACGSFENPGRYCDISKHERYDNCFDSCSRASSLQSHVDRCRYGCEFWDYST